MTMLDFLRVRSKSLTMAELTAGLTSADLASLTNEMIDCQLALLDGCSDADVTFQPVDPNANDTYAARPEDADLAWTLGHVIVHVTASSEESAFLAAELARGVANHGRSRYETPWESVTTVAQLRRRLEESRRMRLASLSLWPELPDLENSYLPWTGAAPVNAVSRFVSGLGHDDAHLAQIAEIIRQAKAAQMVGA